VLGVGWSSLHSLTAVTSRRVSEHYTTSHNLFFCIFKEVRVSTPELKTRLWCFWRESGVWRSVLCWCVWQESGFSRHENVFTFNLVKNDIFYNFCTFNAICKDNAAINCIAVHKKKVSFPSTLTGHTMLAR
jgi:hypothetical protein